MDFYDKFIDLCNKAGESPSPLAEKLGMHRTAVTNWKKRLSTPTPANLKKIADHFGVPVSYFEEDAKDERSLFAIIDTHEKKLLEIYRQLGTVEQAKLIVFASELKDQIKKGDK